MGLELDFHLMPQFSVVGLLGYHYFDAANASVDDEYW
jgi:hypothetical protein